MVCSTFAATVERPLQAADRLAEFAAEQASLLTQLSKSRELDAEARLHDGELIAETDTDVDTGRLGKLIEQWLPEIDLPELGSLV